MYDSSLHRRTGALGWAGAALAIGALLLALAVADAPGPVEAPLLLALVGMAVRDEARPAMERVTDAVDRLAAGEYDVEVPADRDDELGRLAESVDRLAEDLRTRERERREQSEYTDDLFDAVDDVFYVLDREGYHRRWNEGLKEVTGYDDDELAEMHALESFRAADRDAVAETIDAAFRTGSGRVEAAYRTKSGEFVPYEFVASRVDDPDGEPVLTGIGRDVSERERYEREAERTTELLEQAQRIAGVSGWELDVDGEEPELTATDELYRQVGLDPGDELDVGALVEAYHPDDRPRIEAEIERALDGGESYDVLARFRRPDGSTRWMRTIGEPVEKGGEIVGIRGSMQDVTERRERERTLRERERQLSTLMDNVPGMVYRGRNEPDWPLEFLSEGCRELTGYEPERLEEGGDVSWSEDVLRGDDDALWERVQSAVDDREPFQVTYPIETADGERRWIGEQGRGVFDDDGALEALEGVMIDVTEQVESQRELERTTDMLEQSQRLANVGPWEIDRSGEAPEPWLSDEVARIHGLAPGADVDLEEAIDFYHPEDRPTIRDAIERAIEDGGSYDLELRLQPADGDRRWVRTIGEPVVEGGDVVAVRGSFQDITDRKERERELERAGTIMQAVGEPVYALDADGTFRFVNDAVETVAGWNPDDLLGEHVSTVMSEESLETALELIRELRGSDEPYRTFEMDLLTPDGGVIETETNLALLPAEDGEFAGTAGVVHDITDRKERERALERTRDLLQRVQRMAEIGGWELELRTDEREITWTEECYRLHDLPPDADLDLETILRCYHPDDRRRIRRVLERSLDREASYDLEGRLVDEAGEHRWVRAMGEPIRDGGDLVAYRGAVQDVTDRKERELALESLHETALELLNADSVASVAERVVETAEEVLDVAGVSLYVLDDGTNELDPVAFTPGFVDVCGSTASVGVGADSMLWNAFATGARTAVDDPTAIGRSTVLGDAVDQALLVPIGDHGVFVVVTTETAIEETRRRLVGTLAATAEAAFDRLESEASLRERDAALEERNRRLERQIRITEIIRSIDRSLVRAETREAIERTVPEQLVEADGISFAWIGASDVAGDELDPRAWAGDDGAYLDAVPLDPAGSAEPAAIAASRGEPIVVPNVVDRLTEEPWRKEALGRGFQSVVAVPLAYEGYTYGVLAVYADDPEGFAELERTVFAELGESIANAVNAVRTRAALYAETQTELTLHVADDEEVLTRLARAGECRVEYEGLGPTSAGDTLVYLSTDGADAAAVTAALDELVGVEGYRLVSRTDDACRFEVTVTGETIAGRLVRHGATPRSMVADGDETEVVVDVPPTTDVRGFVEMLRANYERVDLRGRRDVEREGGTSPALVDSLLEALTPRQLEVLRTAYFAGFFEWPRASTGQEIAETLDVSQPTVNRHVRLGQGRILAQLFEHDLPGEREAR